MSLDSVPAAIAAAIVLIVFAMVWPNIQLRLEIKRRENQDEN